MIDIKKLKKLTHEFTVLYVEDDKNIQHTMHTYLNKLFRSVAVADDGEKGLDLYANNSYDIVITDLSMPKMDGIEMITKIKEINEDQLVLITSAHAETDYMIAAIKVGIDGYIIKPFEYPQLNAELYKIANRLEVLQENIAYKEHLEELLEKKTSLLVSALRTQNENYEKTLYAMVDVIEERDTYTAGHSKRVATYSKMIAQKMGYSADECAKLYQAGMLHDVGKIVTPDAVLLKPKHLNDLEYRLIKEHVNVGYKILKKIPMFASLAEIIYAHHERYDGSGYPRGLKAEEIPPLARIMMVADSFDAMTTNRIYKGRKSVDEALKELDSLSKIQYYPEVVEAAINVLKEIKIDSAINQLPKNEVEEMRFAYFYKDSLTQVYNEHYLDFILSKNRYEKKYIYMYVLFLHKISNYNKEKGWDNGNKLLEKTADILSSSYGDALVFRVFGDDFVILCKNKVPSDKITKLLDKTLKNIQVTYLLKEIDLSRKSFNTIVEIEQFEHEK